MYFDEQSGFRTESNGAVILSATFLSALSTNKIRRPSGCKCMGK